MKEIKVLDCTLRDGGYCNNWRFGKRNIERIIESLTEAGILLVEYGYLDEKCVRDQDSTKIPSFSDIFFTSAAKYLFMINYGSMSIAQIPKPNTQTGSLRVAFHKKDIDEALLYCGQLQDKGYQVYVQPMVTNSYTLKEYIKLLEQINELKPFAFYIVDSFGSMYDIELNKYLRLADEILQEDIILGFHGHDNTRMAFDNAKIMMKNCNRHTVYIDSSIMGMGRGAGNLSTEIVVEYCNRHLGSNYKMQPILKVIDEVINYFYMDKPWGYTLGYYLAARHNCHPNYASYLDGKKTLPIADMDEIFHSIPAERKYAFDAEYIEHIYMKYMQKGTCDNKNEHIWKEKIVGKKILLLAPGKSITAYEKDIKTYIEENDPIVICVNFTYDKYPADYIFISNIRRYHEWLEKSKNAGECKKLILTSNITAKDYFMKVDYSTLLLQEEVISDNAGLMAIRFLSQYKIEEIMLAGYDGYQYEDELNYVEKEMKIDAAGYQKEEINDCIKSELEKMRAVVNIQHLTPTRYEGK